MPGFGMNGGMARCFPEWQSFVECYSSKRTTEPTKQCLANAEDYAECLHHRKEKARALRINAEANRQAQENGKSPINAAVKKFDVEQLGLVKDE